MTSMTSKCGTIVGDDVFLVPVICVQKEARNTDICDTKMTSNVMVRCQLKVSQTLFIPSVAQP